MSLSCPCAAIKSRVPVQGTPPPQRGPVHVICSTSLPFWYTPILNHRRKTDSCELVRTTDLILFLHYSYIFNSVTDPTSPLICPRCRCPQMTSVYCNNFQNIPLSIDLTNIVLVSVDAKIKSIRVGVSNLSTPYSKNRPRSPGLLSRLVRTPRQSPSTRLN